MNRPKGLTLTAVLMAVCHGMGWATIDYTKPQILKTLGSFTLLICIGYVVIWFYWNGRNWARIGILLYSCTRISDLFTWNRISPLFLNTPTHIRIAASAILGGFLFYWLNTRPVVEFFYPENAPPKLGWGRILYGVWIISYDVQHFSLSRAANGAHVAEVMASIVFALCVIAWGIRAGFRTTPTRTAHAQI